jgi:hypothetical protein
MQTYRFDGRAVLDFIPEYRPTNRNNNITSEDPKLENWLNFERYRDIVQAIVNGGTRCNQKKI